MDGDQDDGERNRAARRAGKHWTEKSLYELIRDIEEWGATPRLGDGAVGEVLRSLYESDAKFSNQYLHHTMFSLPPHEAAGIDTDYAHQLKYIADGDARRSYGLLGNVVLFSFVEGGLAEPMLAAEFSRRAAEIPRLLSVEELRRVGRNDPCPCRSGLKFKRCCGRSDLLSMESVVAVGLAAKKRA
jgi:hypothetical protein